MAINKTYLTLEEKMEVLVGMIQDEGFERFDQSDEDFEDFDEYDTEVFSQNLWVSGYENFILDDVRNMSNEDVLVIFNETFDSSVSLEDIDNMKVYLDKHNVPTAEITDSSLTYSALPMWDVI